MTPLEALQLLEQATGHVVANRETHIKLIEAAKVVGKALMAADEKPPEKTAQE